MGLFPYYNEKSRELEKKIFFYKQLKMHIKYSKLCCSHIHIYTSDNIPRQAHQEKHRFQSV